MYSFAPFLESIIENGGKKDLHRSVSSTFCLKIAKKFANFLPNYAEFVEISLEFIDFCDDFYRNFTNLVESKKISDIKTLRKIVKICEISLRFELDTS